ncbi:MAG: YidC/Oxa1 family insertase periplasmic-domain containing protein, partial [Muribaculaceae bacterium]|nr:YidC/Oxa1 family insertase periplasmic-domain containing protein [Muribaculaceae bacterium]
MDKNTGIGLLLMAAVFFGFMWLSPKKETVTDTDDSTPSQLAQQPATPDSLSATEQEWLVKNIILNGEPVILPDSTHATRLNDGNINLTVAGNTVSGTVTVDGKTLDWADISRRDLKKMTALEQRKAVEAVRTASISMGRYGKFARFLSGNDSVLKMENDVIKLQFSAKSGTITRAELKKYDTEYTPDESQKRKEKVVIFNDSTNSLSFQLPLPQAVSTADLYFTPKVLNDSTILMSLPMENGAYWGIEYTLPKGDSYVVGIRIVQENMAGVVESNNRNLIVNWKQDLIRQEKGKMFEERNSALYYKFAGGSVENLSENKNDKEEREAKVRWIGFKNQFFSSVLIAERPFNTADFESTVLKNEPYFLKSFSAEAVSNDYDWNASSPVRFSLFIGPNLYP